MNLVIPCNEGNNVSTEDIFYIEIFYKNKSARVNINTKDQELISKVSGSVEAMEIMLSQFGFIRVDSGVLVNLNRFYEFEKDRYGGIKICFTESVKKVDCSRPGYARIKRAMKST